MTESQDDNGHSSARHETSPAQIEPVMSIVCLVAAAIFIGMFFAMAYVGLTGAREAASERRTIDTLEQTK